jgi:hypothetical protein
MREAMRNWVRFSNEVMTQAIRVGQPLLDAYIQMVSSAVPGLKERARRSCEIPETECSPRCVCELEWDACEGDTVTGTIEIRNTGKENRNFKLSASPFRSQRGDSGAVPQLMPNSFALAPGEAKTVTVSVHVDPSFDPNDVYRSEVKIVGRYEQCVRLTLNIRRKVQPHCEVAQGEIPTRIVAHQWYDHFQCEELCFEPAGETRTPGASTPDQPGTAPKQETNKKTKG